MVDYLVNKEDVGSEEVELRALFTGIGLTELALGIALWLWGRHVTARSSGRRGAIANAFSRVGLAVGVTAIIGRLLPLFDDVETFASGDISSIG